MMSEKRYYVNCLLYLCDNDLSNTLSIFECADLLNQLTEENEKLRKQVIEYDLILRQHEFAEKEGFK